MCIRDRYYTLSQLYIGHIRRELMSTQRKAGPIRRTGTPTTDFQVSKRQKHQTTEMRQKAHFRVLGLIFLALHSGTKYPKPFQFSFFLKITPFCQWAKVELRTFQNSSFSPKNKRRTAEPYYIMPNRTPRCLGLF